MVSETASFRKRLLIPLPILKNFKKSARERFLTEIELARLGDAIRQAETNGIPWREPDRSNPKSKHAPKLPENRLTVLGPHAAAALRLLIFTGARLREILDLEWDHVDLQRGLLFLPDSKTGKKRLYLEMPPLRCSPTSIALANTSRPQPEVDSDCHGTLVVSNPAGAKLGMSCVETVCRARSLVTQPLDRTNFWSLG